MQNFTTPQQEYDPRWFIWTIVFLVVTGISLVSYIMLSDNGANGVAAIPGPRFLEHTHTVVSSK